MLSHGAGVDLLDGISCLVTCVWKYCIPSRVGLRPNVGLLINVLGLGLDC